MLRNSDRRAGAVGWHLPEIEGAAAGRVKVDPFAVMGPERSGVRSRIIGHAAAGPAGGVYNVNVDVAAGPSGKRDALAIRGPARRVGGRSGQVGQLHDAGSIVLCDVYLGIAVAGAGEGDAA